jgi:1-acyl-sn-glycerol-3-phosphate acyltransferase
MQLLKSLFFTAFMMVSALAFGGFMALCFLAPYRTQFGIARSWARLQFWLLGKVCGLTFTVEGRERIPAGNHIVMSNHTSA